MDYKELYEQESERNAVLSERLAELEEEKEEIAYKLKRIKDNPIWKASRGTRGTRDGLVDLILKRGHSESSSPPWSPAS